MRSCLENGGQGRPLPFIRALPCVYDPGVEVLVFFRSHGETLFYVMVMATSEIVRNLQAGRNQLSTGDLATDNSQISNTELKHAEQIIWSFYGSSHGCFQLEVWRLLAES